MSEFVKFYKGQSTSLPATVKQGALYHCLDTKDTWLATNDKYAGLTLFSCAKFDSLTDVTISASDLNNFLNYLNFFSFLLISYNFFLFDIVLLLQF